MIRIYISLIIFLGIVPQLVLAQLSSTNYQVDVQYVGEEGGGTATSTNYQIDGSSGSPYEYDPTSPDTENSDGVTWGSRNPQDGTNPNGGAWPGQGGGGTGGTGGIGSGIGAEGASDSDSPSPTDGGGSNGGSLFEPPRGDSPVGEGMSSNDTVTLLGHLWGMFLEQPYLYSFILLGILLLILFLLRSIRSEE